MANKYDARPFIDLQKDAEEFQTKFEEDIEKCKSILDAKITTLIRDPDSLGNSVGLKQNALVEFSKAKYDIYISMKSLMNDMEREWLKYISEMKKLFIDNVEVFLANTKLEVKLPASGSLLSPGPRKSLSSKSSAVTSSIYPIINSITKNIPGFTQNKFLEMERSEVEMESSSGNEISDDEDTDKEKSYVPEPSSRYGRKGRFSDQKRNVNGMSPKNVSSSESQRETSEHESAISKERIDDSDESDEIMETETNNIRPAIRMPLKKGKRKQTSKKLAKSKVLEGKVVAEQEYEDNLNVVPVTSEIRRGKSAVAKNMDGRTSKPPGRATRRKTMNATVVERVTSVSPKTATFTQEHDITDVSETETSVVQSSKSRNRRKTLLPNLQEDVSDTQTSVAQSSKSRTRRKTLLPNLQEDMPDADIIPGSRTFARSKRKTISGVSDISSVAPSKRLKTSNQKLNVESDDVVTEDNPLEIGDGYSEWISLKSIDGKTPTGPGIYEVKVWRAKKSAYIGSCDNLRQKLTLHKLKQNSGHKHLDKFIERNYDDIQIRYEVITSINDAKVEVKNRVNNFVAQHKTTPAYN